MLDHDLRASALDALGPHADPRAFELLRRADVTLSPTERTWEGSDGTVHGHRVRVLVDARSLGVAAAHPGVVDALHEAFARALSNEPLHSLDALALGWNGALATSEEAYRGGVLVEGRARLADALAAFFEGAGSAEDAARARGLALACPSPDEVVASPAPHDATFAAAVRDAARALLGPGVRVTWRSR